jgi:exodeoxyribonuclease-3
MQLISYNLNGIRSALRKGLADWLAQHAFDVLCFQEVKATADVVDLAPFEQLGYAYHWHAAEKKGYSGVATFSRIAPTNVVLGLWIGQIRLRRPHIRTDFGDLTLLNCYFPSGTTARFGRVSRWNFCAISMIMCRTCVKPAQT